MALSYNEILGFREANKIPQSMGNEIANLSEYIIIGAKKYAAQFQQTHKNIDAVDLQGENVNAEANAYLNKILRVCRSVLRFEEDRRTEIKESFLNIILAYLGTIDQIKIGGNNVTFTAAQIDGATAVQWEEFLDDIMPRVFEVLAITTANEKAEYNLL